MNQIKMTEATQVIMPVLDELSEEYFIHRPPTIRKSDNLSLGWGNKRKTSDQCCFRNGKTEPKEIETRSN